MFYLEFIPSYTPLLTHEPNFNSKSKRAQLLRGLLVDVYQDGVAALRLRGHGNLDTVNVLGRNIDFIGDAVWKNRLQRKDNV
jgi:hypothetical protein